MFTLVIAILIFLVGYLLNMFYITVLYHRGLTHNAVQIRPFMMKWLSWSGTWVTGLEPKAWACMHRLHHLHSDTEKDPHSPVQNGVMGVWLAQYYSYREVITKLNMQDSQLSQVVKDIPFGISFLNRYSLSNLPYFLHAFIAFLLSFFSGYWVFGFAYFLGIMSHPIQGWMVNALAHRFGYRNFDTDDQSKNNLFVSFLVFGEGFQNNHHAFPARAKFSCRPYEFDFGYGLCWIAEKLGLVQILRN